MGVSQSTSKLNFLTHIYRGEPVRRPRATAEGAETRELVYGEITMAGIDKLFAHIPSIQNADFVDLGSGTGKVVNYVALKYPVKVSRGVEIVPKRHKTAKQMQDLIQRKFHMAPVHFTLGNFRALSMRKPTHVYTCSTCFSNATMNSILNNMLQHATADSPKYLLTQKKVTETLTRVQLMKTVHNVGVSWNKQGAKYYVYKLT